ncbi:MAG: hypothetical protein IIA89_07630 [Chloroflexi bacterium]|nr:hypothetical protein [Chloroflexota bacterium]
MKTILIALAALALTACSSPEAEPTPTPEPTATPLPTSTPEPTVTQTSETTSTPSPTAEPEESLPEDTSDLFVGPGYSFRFPAGWDMQVFSPQEGYYSTSPILVITAPQGTAALLFEIVTIDELGGDPSQALERYVDLRMGVIRKESPDLEITNDSFLLGVSADGGSEGRQIEWVIPSKISEGITQLYIAPNGVYGYMFESTQQIGLDRLPGLGYLGFAVTSFFPIAASLDSAYAPFGNPFSDFGFAFGIPSDAQTTVTSVTGSLDQLASAEDGVITLGFPSTIPELRAYLSWSSSDAILTEKALQDLLNASTTSFDRFLVTSLGKLYVGSFAVDGQLERFEGRYFQGDVPSGQVMLGAWQCPGDRRVYVLQVENDFSATFLETLFLFQRFLIGFACP